jgi:proteic killer suppression protein
MIGSFKDRRLKRLYEAGDRSKLAPEHVEKIENILARLEAAATIEDMNLPGFRLHPLKGDLKGVWSVTVRANWRIIFRFENGTALDVELTDYH